MLSEESKVSFDERGHQSWVSQLQVYDLTTYMTYEERVKTHLAWTSGTPIKNPIKIRLENVRQCKNCGAGRTFWFDGFQAVSVDVCSKAAGIPVQATLSVPSGKILVGNDFRRFYPIQETIASVNYNYGIEATIRAYEKVGMLHFFVGNTSPSVYETSKDEFVVAGAIYDDEGEEIGLGTLRAEVCTDLWWVSICDYEDAVSKDYQQAPYHHDSIINVTPGIYELDYHALKAGFEQYPKDGACVYANLVLKKAF